MRPSAPLLSSAVRLLCFAALRILKLPKRWLLPIVGLRGDVPYAVTREETSGNDDGVTAMPPAAPTNTLVKTASVSTEGNGKSGSQHKWRGIRSHGGNGRQKPR